MVGWISTDAWSLDVTQPAHFKRLLGGRLASAFLAEHVWEHLTAEQARLATANCYRFLRPGGYLRIAVPDGLHPDRGYIDCVRPGGTGAGADDHKQLYTHRTLWELLHDVGFEVRLLEWWSEAGEFHYQDWSSEDGMIRRSRRYDPRNQNGALKYTSLIVDAFKPQGSHPARAE